MKYKIFETIEEFKAASQFYAKGSIVPAKIMKITKGRKRQSCCINFGSDTWAFSCENGYILLVGHTPFMFRRFSTTNVSIAGAPYHRNGTMAVHGNLDGNALARINGAIQRESSI